LPVAQQLAVPARREAAPYRGEPRVVERVDDHGHERHVQERVAERQDGKHEVRAPPHASPAISRTRLRCSSAIGTTSSTSSRIATADASGQSLFTKNSSNSTRPIMSDAGPPRR